MPMGEKEGCDDGKKNLKMDLGDMEDAITCYTGAKKYGSSHIKNDRPVVLWKKKDQSKEVCRMPSPEYSPKHKCMDIKIAKPPGAVLYPLMARTDLYGQALACTGISHLNVGNTT